MARLAMCKRGKSVDSQKPALACELIKQELNDSEQILIREVQYSDIFW